MNQTYLGLYISKPYWKCYTNWVGEPLPSEYNQFAYKMMPKFKVTLAKKDNCVGDYYGYPISVTWPGDEKVAKELANLARFNTSPEEGVDTWARYQEYLTQRNENPEETNKNLPIEYSMKLAQGRNSNIHVVNYICPPDNQNNLQTPTYMIEERFKASKRLKGTADSKHKSRRFKCPDCNVTQNEYGYCPVCNSRIYPNRYRNGGSKSRVPRYDRVVSTPYHYVREAITGEQHPEPIMGYNIPDLDEGDKIFKEQFNKTFKLSKLNFIGFVHKKSSGRDPTGWLSHKQEETRKWLHPTPIMLNANISYERTGVFVKVNGQEKELYKSKVTGECECGCNFKAKDLMRGEIVCPKCGIVFGRMVGDSV